VRMALYRRLSELDEREIDNFAAEMIDRFGPLPEEVEHLLKIAAIKQLCRAAMVAKIEAGPKGATLSFRHNSFPNAGGLVKLIAEHAGTMKVRPDQTVVVMREWPTPYARIKGAESLLRQLSRPALAA
jgi:transcription-repair coupling factor (superfamily II helicase)